MLQFLQPYSFIAIQDFSETECQGSLFKPLVVATKLDLAVTLLGGNDLLTIVVFQQSYQMSSGRN